MRVTDWRYIVSYDGIVTADTEDEARFNALDDSDGKIPVVDVQKIEGSSDE